jgi:hypothetical protein
MYGRDAILPIELEMPNLPDNNGLTNDFQAQFLERIQILTGILNDNRQKAQDNISKNKKNKNFDMMLIFIQLNTK